MGRVGMVVVLGLLAARAEAGVLCQQKKTAHLLLRPSACKRQELPVDVTQLVGAQAAVGSVTLTGSTAATTPTALDSFTVNVSGPGTLQVTVAGMIMINADSTTQQALTVPARIGLCDTAASDSQCGGTYSQIWYQDADDNDNLNTTVAFTLARSIAVTAAGPRVFYVNGEAPPSPGASLALWKDPIVGEGPVATATFVPAALTVTSP